MREVTGSTWSFQAIILFILIFAAFLSLVIIYSKVYIVKNEALTIIEKYDGITTESLDILNNYVLTQGYKEKGSCDEGWVGVNSIDKKDYEKIENKSNKKYYYCFQKVNSDNTVYYNVRFFYKFNLPVLGDIITFKVNGRTKSILPAKGLI